MNNRLTEEQMYKWLAVYFLSIIGAFFIGIFVKFGEEEDIVYNQDPIIKTVYIETECEDTCEVDNSRELLCDISKRYLKLYNEDIARLNDRNLIINSAELQHITYEYNINYCQ